MKKYLIVKSLIAVLMLGVANTALPADAKAGGNQDKPAGERREEVKKLTPEEREAKRKERLEKLDKRLEELRKKKADGTLTGTEQKQLDRLELVKKNAGKPPVKHPHAKPHGDNPAAEKPEGDGKSK